MPPHNEEERETFAKVLSFWSIGILTLVYCIAELGAAVYLGSLTLLSDGFHNLSDVASLYVAYWALKASKRGSGDDMTYGWARTELIGGLINGCALLSLCAYIVLEAIPRFIAAIQCSTADATNKVEVCDHGSDDMNTPHKALIFIYIAAAGLAVNTIGTIVFSLTGHGHSHAGGGHNHSHGGEEDHGHSHKDKKKKKHGHSHGKTPGGEEDHGHSHKKKKKHGHSHGEPEKESLLSSHGHDSDEEDHHDSHPEHAGEELNTVRDYKEKKHGHSHDKGHDHGHGHGDKKKEKKVDMNVRAVFLHYLGDMLSSAFVLVTGLLFFFFSPHDTSSTSASASGSGFSKAEEYLQYLDPTASCLIVILILATTIPMVKRCAVILLQSSPPDVDLNELRRKLHEIPEIHGVHDLHVWQLVDGLAISSVHVVVDYHVQFSELQHKVKKVFHKMGIHSTAIQPEFVDTQLHMRKDYCETNCVKECEEDWCCKKNAEEVEMRGLSSVHSMP